MSREALCGTLDLLARDGRDLLDPWWLIGSAAAWLLGLEGPVKDVDLLTSRRDAETLIGRWGIAPVQPQPSPIFRSALFAVRGDLAVPIELMADFSVRGQPLVPGSRVRIGWGKGALFVPDAAEQVTICERFGREKDLARAALLRRLLPHCRSNAGQKKSPGVTAGAFPGEADD